MKANKTGCVLELLSPAPEPYQLWSGDEWKCDGCGATVITGYGRAAMFDAHADPEGYAAHRAYEAEIDNVVTIEV
jgi:hypothetical protein